jgi:dolichol-phosphate mannosyltransferase
VVIIPTYDERENVGPISRAVLKVQPTADVLFVDDNSPDGTGQVIDGLCAQNAQIHVLHRERKTGLGRAYIQGFKWALERGYDFIFQMDADFSHDPEEIPNFLRAAEQADLVSGSRYVNGIRIVNWPLSRLILSKGAATYVRIITGMPVSDPTSGFKCYRRAVLEEIDLNRILSIGYCFLVEMTYTAWIKGFRVAEIPITFVDRRSGYSKMNTAIFWESLLMVWRLSIKNGFRRAPRKRSAKA